MENAVILTPSPRIFASNFKNKIRMELDLEIEGNEIFVAVQDNNEIIIQSEKAIKINEDTLLNELWKEGINWENYDIGTDNIELTN